MESLMSMFRLLVFISWILCWEETSSGKLYFSTGLGDNRQQLDLELLSWLIASRMLCRSPADKSLPPRLTAADSLSWPASFTLLLVLSFDRDGWFCTAPRTKDDKSRALNIQKTDRDPLDFLPRDFIYCLRTIVYLLPKIHTVYSRQYRSTTVEIFTSLKGQFSHHTNTRFSSWCRSLHHQTLFSPTTLKHYWFMERWLS